VFCISCIIILPLHKTRIAMAKPIKETPLLRGKDATLFNKNKQENASKRVSASERKRIRANFKKLNSIAE
jgi:hypothetical protein